jgi:hypothetical protein
MKSKTITVNNIEVVVHSDGSISKPDNRLKDKRIKRTFGHKNGNGYMSVAIGYKMFQMHRIVAQALLSDFLDYPEVDHIDGNKANNDISNLRMATSQFQKRAYRAKSKGCYSQYRGVTWSKRDKKWYARCKINGKFKSLGYFDDERDAAIARDAYAFSQGFPKEGLNFPENYA